MSSSSVVSEREQKLILDLLLGRLTEDAFRRAFPLTPDGATAASLAMLRAGLRRSDPIAVEFGLYLGHRFGFSPEHLEVLCALARADFHERHEDVVDGLAALRLAGSEDALYAAALSQHPYRDYDDADSLGVKASWALRKLGTPEAVEKLGALLRSDRQILSSEARERLEDLARSATDTNVQELARLQLAAREA